MAGPGIGIVDSGADNQAGDSPVLEWSVRLNATRRKAVWGIGACVLLVAIAGSVLFKNAALGLIPAAAIVLSLSEFLFPIHYRFTNNCVTMRNGLVWLEMPWTDIRHAYITADGIKLSPLKRKNSRAESLRGIFVRFGDQDRDVIVREIQRLCPQLDKLETDRAAAAPSVSGEAGSR